MSTVLAPFPWTKFTLAGSPAKEEWPTIVNRVVNNGIDAAQGILPPVAEEVWRVWPKFGWCHDYAVTKREELLLRGYHAGELLLAEVKLIDGEHHLVLVVNGQVLDNLTSLIHPWPRYELVRIQSTDDPNIWVAA